MTSGLLAVVLGSILTTPQGSRDEISFDIWDWTEPAKSIELFETWVEDLKSIGVTRIELSVPWKALEPRPDAIDLAWLSERLAVCKRHGLGMLLRMNSYYSGACPDWYEGHRWTDAHGKTVPQGIPSITDERFWAHYGRILTAAAALCKGEDVYFNAFIGVHAELKWSDWWSYDPATLGRWREVIAATPRPAWLVDVVGVADLPEQPPVPGPTQGVPDREPANRAWVAFREQCWRDACERFVAAIRKGDPKARISCPLGESYRRESASMSNLDYYGLTRGADHIVHSYDFFWHAGQPAWNAAAAVASFRGITGLPVQFEVDSLDFLTEKFGYSTATLVALGRNAALAGAGLKLANNSYSSTLPSQRPLVRDLIGVWRAGLPKSPSTAPRPREEDTVLLFMSKWANYSYREETQWLHEAQFGVYKLFSDLGVPVRIICEDNLGEDLSRYKMIYCAFSPRELLPASAARRLEALDLPSIEDMPMLPAARPATPLKAEGVAKAMVTHADCPSGALDLSKIGEGYAFGLQAGECQLAACKPGHVVLGFPMGYMYLHGSESQELQGLLLWSMLRALE